MKNRSFILFLCSFFLTSALWAVPDRVTGLKTLSTGYQHIKLSWIAPYDTVSATTPYHYELRLSTRTRIDTEFKWANNSSKTFYPYIIKLSTGNIITGTTLYYTVTGLINDQSYFFAIKSSTHNVFAVKKSTETGWWSPLSGTDDLDKPVNTFPPDIVVGQNLVLTGGTTNTLTPKLSWTAVSPGTGEALYGDSVTYHVEISTSSNSDRSVLQGVILAKDNITTNYWIVSPALQENTTYWWRVRAVDSGGKTNDYTNPLGIFVTNAVNEVPLPFDLSGPGNNSITPNNPNPAPAGMPTFSWEKRGVPDPWVTVKYMIFFSTDPKFSVKLTTHNPTNISAQSYQPNYDLIENATYYWMVHAFGNGGKYRVSSSTWAVRINKTSEFPYDFALTLTSPTNASIVSTSTPVLVWQKVDLPDPGDTLIYKVIYSTVDPKSYSNVSQMPNLSTTGPDKTEGQYKVSPLKEDTTYWWRVNSRSNLNQNNHIYSNIWSFYVNGVNEPPSAFNLLHSSGVTNNRTPTFGWQVSKSTDNYPVTYTIYYSKYDNFGIATSSGGLTNTSFTPGASLDADSTYYWKVEARDNRAGVTSSGIWKLIITNNGPSSFSLLTSSGIVNIQRPVFKWQAAIDPNFDPVTYTFYYSKTEDFSVSGSSSGLSATSFTPASVLDENSTYYWKVQASDNHSGTISSAIWKVVIDANPENPADFNLLSPANGLRESDPSVLFKWETTIDPDPFDYVASYSLYYSTTAGLNNPTVIPGLKVSSYTISTSAFIEDITYYWFIKAVSKLSGATDSQTRNFIISNHAPAAFDYISSSGIIKSINVSLAWNNSIDPENDPVTYTLYYSTRPDFALFTSSAGLSTTKFNLSGLNDHTTYYWYVNASDTRANKRVQSNKAWSFHTNYINYPPLPFNQLYPANGTILSDISTYLQWQKTTDPDLNNTITYSLWYSTSSSFAFKTVLNRQASNYYRFDSELLFGTTYYWRVYAVGASGNSNDITVSQTWQFTIIGRKKPAVPQNFTTTLDSAKTKVVLAWDAVTKNADGSSITNLKGYKIFKSYSFDDIYAVSATTNIPSGTVSWTDTRSFGQTVYYYIRAYNELNEESNDSVLKTVGETNLNLSYPVDQSVTVEYSTDILPSTMTVEVTRQSNSTDSRILGAYTVKVLSQNSEVPGYAFREPFTLRFRKTSFQAVLGKAVTLGSSYVGVYWYNGVAWAYIGGQIDNGDIVVKTPYTGSYELRKVLGTTEFKILNTWPKIITPNGDGTNDVLNCTFENPTANSVDANIYDLNGARIGGFTSLTDTWLTWDGKDENGQKVLPGIYVYQLKVGTKIINGTVVVAR